VTDPRSHPTFDTSVAHIARVYDYLLGGKDNYEADRKAGDAAIEAYPHTVSSVRANRAFLTRVVRFLAGEAGIRQFLDIGTGIPTVGNTHEVAQSVAPEARVLYVDYDPVVLAHARALMASNPAGATNYVDADLRDTSKILERAAGTLDFTQPVAVMLIGILHFIGDEDQPYDIVSRLLDAVPPGSYLAISHMASDISAAQVATAKARLDEMMYQQGHYRTQAEVVRFFDGLELVEPGVVPIQKWRPDSEMEAQRAAVLWGGVGRKG
jgi:O-methyltransferase involved in polyketide biosynthesis